MGNEHLVPSIMSLLERFKWRKVQIIYQKNKGFLDLRDQLVSKLERDPAIKYEIRNTTELPANITKKLVRNKFQNVRHQSKSKYGLKS